MAKTSAFYSVGEKKRITNKNTIVLDEKYDDRIYVRGFGTFIPDPSKQWFIKSSTSLSGNEKMIAVMNGDNLYGDVLWYAAPYGLFYNEDMKSAGIVPVNYHLVGNSIENIKYTQSDQEYYIGWYQHISKFWLWDDNDPYWMNNPPFFFTGIDGSAESYPLTNFFINDRSMIPVEKMCTQLTTGQSSVSWYIYNVFAGTNGNEVSLISQTPLIFTLEDNTFSGQKPILTVTLTKPTKKNFGNIQVYGVHSASPIYMLKKAFNFDGESVDTYKPKYGKLIQPYGSLSVSNTNAAIIGSIFAPLSIGFTEYFGKNVKPLFAGERWQVIYDHKYGAINEPIIISGVQARSRFTRKLLFQAVYEIIWNYLHFHLQDVYNIAADRYVSLNFIAQHCSGRIKDIRSDFSKPNLSQVKTMFANAGLAAIDNLNNLFYQLSENWTDLPKDTIHNELRVDVRTIFDECYISLSLNTQLDLRFSSSQKGRVDSIYLPGTYMYFNETTNSINRETIIPIGSSGIQNDIYETENSKKQIFHVSHYFGAGQDMFQITNMPREIYDDKTINEFLYDDKFLYKPGNEILRLLGHPYSRSVFFGTPGFNMDSLWPGLSKSSIFTITTPYIQASGPYQVDELRNPIFPDDVTLLQPNIQYPFPIMADTYKIVQFDRLYDESERFGTFTQLITGEHWSTVRSIKDDIISSDDIDKLIGLDKITDDYFIANLLKTDLNDIQSMNQSVDQLKTPEQMVEDIMKEFEDKHISTINNLLSKNDTPKLSPIDKHNVRDALLSNLKDVQSNLIPDKIPEKQEVIDKYNEFKMLFLSKVQDESKTAIIGHARILATNITESPLYSSIKEEYEISDDQIKSYINMMKLEMDSALNTDVWTLVDSLDSINEINMISSMVSDQINELSASFDSITNDLTAVKDANMTKIKEVNDKVSAIMNVAKNTANSIIEGSNGYIKKIDDLIDQVPGTYNAALFTRNINNATGYLTGFAQALISDPYLALKQHAEYIRARSDKISLKSSIIEGALKVLDFIPKIPKLVIDGIGSVAKLVVSMSTFALSTALETVTIIDNIDKIVFLSEQYLSKGIIGSSTIPTVYDDMFTPPSIATSKYEHFKKKAAIELDVDTSITKIIQDRLNDTLANPIKLEDGTIIKYNNYDVNELFGDMGGYYYPINGDYGLPIIQVANDKSILLPDLTDFDPIYPQRGNLWKYFIKQLAYNEPDLIDAVENLSPFIPVTEELIAVYYGFAITASFIAGTAAATSAMLKGDWLGAAISAPIAASLVFGVNVAETHIIANRRTYVNSDENVYSWFSLNYDKLKTKWESITPTLIGHNDTQPLYKFVTIKESEPLFHDASDFKKYYLQVKEILFLIGNIVTMGAVSFMIGKLGSKISGIVRTKKARKSLRIKNQQERKKYESQADELKKNIDSQILETQANNSLSQDEKDKIISNLEKEKKGIDKWLKGEINLLPTGKLGLNGILASNYGIGSLATSSAAPGVSNLATLGPLTESALKPFNQQLEKLQNINPEINDANNEINDSDQESSTGIASLISSSSELLKALLKVQTDVDDIKKFV